MSVKNWLRSWFGFGRKDRFGLLALALLILIVFALPRFFRREADPPRRLEPALAAAVDSFNREASARPRYSRESPAPRSARPPAERFPFDPNTLDEEGWVRLGLQPRTAATIVKYRSRGGRFRRPEDLQKIWGLPAGFYESVKGLIRLEQEGTTASGPAEKPSASSRPAYERKTPAPVGINTADTAAWIALPGIGSKLAARIVAFRDKLGGFVRIDQVAETYGLRDSSFQLILPYLQLDGGIRRIDINTATVEEMKDHPYIRWNGARAIAAYRQQHGRFASPEDIRRINVFDETSTRKLLPYIRVE